MSRQNIATKIKSFIKRKTSQKYRFNLQYENKQWDGLRNINDLGRYSLIVGYIKFFCQKARVLDIGCGEGIMLERLSQTDYVYYLGVDISDVAIANAQCKAGNKSAFIVGNADNLNIDGSFDVIIYNESIYYLKDPKASVSSILKSLNPSGVIIISTYNRKGKEYSSIWEQLSEILTLADRTVFTNRNNDSWTLHIYQAK